MPQTVTSVTATTRRLLLTVTDTPTIEQLQVWWEAMQSDDLRVAYDNSFPPALSDFRLRVARGETLLLLSLVDGQVAGALWLHDLWHRRDGSVAADRIGAYFLAAYRGRLLLDLWQPARQHWEAAGIVHFFSAANAANQRLQVLLARGDISIASADSLTFPCIIASQPMWSFTPCTPRTHGWPGSLPPPVQHVSCLGCRHNHACRRGAVCKRAVRVVSKSVSTLVCRCWSTS